LKGRNTAGSEEGNDWSKEGSSLHRQKKMTEEIRERKSLGSGKREYALWMSTLRKLGSYAGSSLVL
jgi:hypothetical protein